MQRNKNKKLRLVVDVNIWVSSWGWGFLNHHNTADSFRFAASFGFSMISIGAWSLAVMIPVWITALILNLRYAKN